MSLDSNPSPTCSVHGCTNPVRYKDRGWCGLHYQRWRKTGDPLGLRPRGRRMFTAETEAEITALYLGGGADKSRVTRAIIDWFACSDVTIRRIVERNGAQTRPVREARYAVIDGRKEC